MIVHRDPLGLLVRHLEMTYLYTLSNIMGLLL